MIKMLINAFICKSYTNVVGFFNVRPSKLELVASVILLVSIWSISSLQVNILHAMPDAKELQLSQITPSPSNNSSNITNTPSVLPLSSLPLDNSSNSSNSPSPSSTLESPSSNKVFSNDPTHDTGSNSGTHHTHHGISISSSISSISSSIKHNSHESTQKIINKVKERLKVGDIPFP
jgi:cytoskeletal protein RodZ